MSKAQPRYDTASRTPRGRQNRSFRRGLVEGERGFPAKPLNPTSPAAPPVSEDGIAYQFSQPAPEPRGETSLEAALRVADYWRTKCIALLEENYQLKKDVLEAVAEKLRLAVVVKEPEP